MFFLDACYWDSETKLEFGFSSNIVVINLAKAAIVRKQIDRIVRIQITEEIGLFVFGLCWCGLALFVNRIRCCIGERKTGYENSKKCEFSITKQKYLQIFQCGLVDLVNTSGFGEWDCILRLLIKNL